MKTEISRDTFREDARYSGIYLQQGRMITDADWNEQVEVARARLMAALGDLIGRGTPGVAGVIDASSGAPTLRWGRVYSDGAAGDVTPDSDALLSQPFNYNRQADYPDTRSLPSQCVLYADIWERPVGYLEDDELRDPALNGADTATRTRTMAQVKWCDAPAPGAQPDCLDESRNPRCGNAELEVGIRESGTTADECDPCAAEIVVTSEARNYLFRLEVHDVAGDPSNPDRITLKWSGENAAEVRSLADAGVVESEPGYATSKYVYEFFDQEMELMLGVDLSGRTISRAELRDFPASATSLGRAFVRRWDGFCTLVNDGSGNWSLDGDGDSEKAFDRGAALSTTSDTEASGHVGLTGGTFSANLESLVIELTLTGHSFVAGDFWLSVIRESADSDRRVTQYSSTPTGIVHHYVEIASWNGAAYEWLSDAHRRRNTFPPVTDLDADHVSYSPPTCPNELFNSSDHDTVQKALDALCGLNATHIAFTSGECDNGLFDASHDTVQKALEALCGLQAAHINFQNCDPDPASSPFHGLADSTVQDALARLCNLAAASVTFANCVPDPATSPFYGLAGATVQDALQRLCNLAAASVTFTNCSPDLPTSPFYRLATPTVQAALEKLCGLSAGSVTYSPPSDCTSLAGTTTVEGALNALCDVEGADNCGARLRLFGRGIVCGVIPSVTVAYKSGLQVPFTVTTTAGTAIDGWGCVVDVGGLTLTGSLTGFRFGIPFTAGITPVVVPVKRWLYLVLPKNGDPYLDLRNAFAGHLATAAAEVAYDNTSCSSLETSAWAPYEQVTCVTDPADGTEETALCIGTLGLRGDRAWICPDDREAILTAPIRTQAIETRDRRSTFSDFAARCGP